jgi:ATP-dependent helicase/nuclease subunit B
VPFTSEVFVKRRFLGWDRPALPSAVDEMIKDYAPDDRLDLGKLVVVVPGQRAGRRLRELLVDAASERNLLLTPPRVVTEGQLPELLYKPAMPFAPPLVRRLAWGAALAALASKVREALVPQSPAENDAVRWLRLGDIVGGLDEELAADGCTIDTLLREAAQIEGFADQARWEALHHVRAVYHAKLAELGACDKFAARQAAIEAHAIRFDKNIILLGMVDLNTVVKSMLTHVADCVTAFVIAPESHADSFDAFGTLDAAAWKSKPTPLLDSHLLFADGPEDQAETAAQWLADLDGEFAVEDVVIGIPDPKLVPCVRRRLQRAGVETRWLESRTIADSAPYRFLEAACQYATHPRYEDFAALVRHPDVEAWLVRANCEIKLFRLDKFYGDHLPERLEPDSLGEASDLRAALTRVNRLLPLTSARRGLREWAKDFRAALQEIYGSRLLELSSETDREFQVVLVAMAEAFKSMGEIPDTLESEYTAAEAFAIAVEPCAREPLPPRNSHGAVELLGWLELPLDDAAAALVTTLNDGFVPSAAGSDAFLPDTLRQRLSLECNDRRFARDAYATTVLAHTKRKLTCLVARRDNEHNPLQPSRLLFAGCETAELVNRLNRWRKAGEVAPIEPLSRDDVASPFCVPKPRKRQPKRQEFRVTEFRDFLACPYRYYLRHIEDLSAVDDTARELDGGSFGSLIHNVLAEWGGDLKKRSCRDVDALSMELVQGLDAQIELNFAESRPVVLLQREQARRRLRSFAQRQVALVNEGWSVVYTEPHGKQSRSLHASWEIDGEPVTLIGRIDRIDYHEADNIVRIIDYKTSDNPMTPEKAHRTKERWIDLQLPLYRHLWRRVVSESVKENATVELCYFQIPKDTNAVALVTAKWDAGVLETADEMARSAIRKIRAEEFVAPDSQSSDGVKAECGKPVRPAPKYFEEYSAICLDNSYAPGLEEDEEVST